MEDRLRECMGFRLGAAWRRLDRVFNRLYEPTGLSHAHAQVLLCVLERDELRVVDIAPLTGLTASTVSRLAADLSKHRYLRRRQDPDDKRSKLLSPANRALTIRAELERVQERVHEMVRAEFAEVDLAELRQMLDLIARQTP